jgi:hypothetical protein
VLGPQVEHEVARGFDQDRPTLPVLAQDYR